MTKEEYDKMPLSDVFAVVCEECQVATVLDMAEQYIPETQVREFLYACLGLDIE